MLIERVLPATNKPCLLHVRTKKAKKAAGLPGDTKKSSPGYKNDTKTCLGHLKMCIPPRHIPWWPSPLLYYQVKSTPSRKKKRGSSGDAEKSSPGYQNGTRTCFYPMSHQTKTCVPPQNAPWSQCSRTSLLLPLRSSAIMPRFCEVVEFLRLGLLATLSKAGILEIRK